MNDSSFPLFFFLYFHTEGISNYGPVKLQGFIAMGRTLFCEKVEGLDYNGIKKTIGRLYSEGEGSGT
ncbi:hypothetical protein [Thalassobacillus devorans]|uniref:hypothetical protein n=1 Tax=Thalassobacillus devorans TaxID=279813 RepID=UPI00048ED241|nr:hypothetical protein [Thalassobacillus devorans]